MPIATVKQTGVKFGIRRVVAEHIWGTFDVAVSKVMLGSQMCFITEWSRFKCRTMYGNSKTATTAPNDPKVTLNITSSRIPHMCIATVLGSQISPRFPLRQAVWSYREIWAPYYQKSPWKLQGPRYPVYMLVVSQFSVCFALQAALSRHKIVKNHKCTEWLHTDLEHLEVKSTQ